MLPKPTCHSEYCIFCSHGWFSCFMVLNALFSRVISVPLSRANLQKLEYNVSTAFGTLFMSSIVKVAGLFI